MFMCVIKSIGAEIFDCVSVIFCGSVASANKKQQLTKVLNVSGRIYLVDVSELTNKLHDIPDRLPVARAEPGLVAVQLDELPHVSAPDAHQDHGDREAAEADQHLLGLLQVGEAAVRDEEDDGVLGVRAGPHRVVGRELQHLAVDGGLGQSDGVEGVDVVLEEALHPPAVGVTGVLVEGETMSDLPSNLRAKPEAEDLLVCGQKRLHIAV